jgi:hypothetical protein
LVDTAVFFSVIGCLPNIFLLDELVWSMFLHVGAETPAGSCENFSRSAFSFGLSSSVLFCELSIQSG